MCRNCVAFLLVAGLVVPGMAATIYYVDDNAPIPEEGTTVDGLTWATAFNDLQLALDVVVAGDEIRVGQGEYRPSLPNAGDPRERTFRVKDGVAIKGGYAGVGADDPDARDAAVYITILTGDILGNDTVIPYPEGLPTEALWNAVYLDPVREDNVDHVLTATDISNSTTVDGFTITGGHSRWYGGGLRNTRSNLVVNDCIFRNNAAALGAVSNEGISQPAFLGCLFELNTGGVGAVYSGWDNTCRPTIIDCVFLRNWTHNYGGAILGGSPTLTNCTFTDNMAALAGGAFAYGFDRTMLTNCTFTRNRAYSGGAMLRVFGTMTNCTLTGNMAESLGGAMCYCDPDITNCTFTTNSAGWAGGAIESPMTKPVTNCSFVENVAAIGGAIHAQGGSPVILSCTFNRNRAGEGGALNNGHESMPQVQNCMFIENSGGGAAVNAYNSGGEYSECVFRGNAGGGMIVFGGSTPSIHKCTFERHSTMGLNISRASPTVEKCTFISNSQGICSSGDMACYPVISNCTFTNNGPGRALNNWAYCNIMVLECTFTGNTGGGILDSSGYPGGCFVNNCTFASNSAESGGGIEVAWGQGGR